MQARRRSRTRAATPVVIDGSAVVLERRSGEPPTAGGNAGSARPTNDSRATGEPPFHFRRSDPRPDLVFPGTTRRPAAASAARSGRSLSTRGSRAALTAAAVCCGLAVAAATFGTPHTVPRAARHSDAPVPASALLLEEARSSLAPHRNGFVLAVEGRIRNRSSGRRAAPVVAVRVPGEPSFRRLFQPTDHAMDPGRSLFFHSTLAVPSATNAAGVDLSLVGADRPETHSTP